MPKAPCAISLSWVPSSHLDSPIGPCLHVPTTGISHHHHSEAVRAPLTSNIVFPFPCVVVYSPYRLHSTSTFSMYSPSLQLSPCVTVYSPYCLHSTSTSIVHVQPSFVAFTTLISPFMSLLGSSFMFGRVLVTFVPGFCLHTSPFSIECHSIQC